MRFKVEFEAKNFITLLDWLRTKPALDKQVEIRFIEVSLDAL